MKINLMYEDQNELNGYLNISGINTDLSKLDTFADNNEVEEIRAINVLEYYGLYQVDELFNHWITKLKHGGIITIQCTDMSDVSKSVVTRSFENLAAPANLIYGTQQEPHLFKKSLFTIGQLDEIFRNRGLKVLQKRVTNFQALIVGVRP